MVLSLETAVTQLQQSEKPFIELFKHGTLSVELYQPDKVDLQQPHDRDEIYVVTSGSGIFNLAGKRTPFTKGACIFVPAFAEHRFEDFTPDFCTWVFFYGPQGGESAIDD